MGMFEQLAASDEEQQLQKREASDKLAAAIYDVRDRFGHFLFGAQDIEGFHDRLALCKNDVIKTVEPHVFPRTGILRRVLKPIEREFRAQLERQADSYTGVDTNPGMMTPTDSGTGLSGGLTGFDPDTGSATQQQIARRLQACGPYKSFDACVAANSDKDDPAAYCGSLEKKGARGENQETAEDDPADFGHGTEPVYKEDRLGSRQAGFNDTDSIISEFHQARDAYAQSGRPDDKEYLRQVHRAIVERAWNGDETARAWIGGHAPHVPDTGRSMAGGRRQAGDGDQKDLKTKVTYKPSDAELKPKGDFEGYLNKVDQGAHEKVQRNFANVRRQAEDGDALWASAVEPVPTSTHDIPGMATQSPTSPRGPEFVSRFMGWCKQAGIAPTLTALDRYAPPDSVYFSIAAAIQRQADFDVSESVLGEPADSNMLDPGGWGSAGSGGEDRVGSRREGTGYTDQMFGPGFENPQAGHGATVGLPPGEVAQPKKLKKNKGNQPKVPHNTDYQTQMGFGPVASRRQAAPDHLQKADEALKNLLNQKASEFQEGIAPLQQALQIVQQAEAEQQAANPLNVIPPAGTVNVLPQSPAGGPQAPAPGVDASQGAPPTPDQGGPPPAAADQGALPPDAGGGGVSPEMLQQLQAKFNSERGGPGKVRGATRPRQAANVNDLWDRWNQDPNNVGIGGEADYDAFSQQFGVGPKALQKLKKQHLGPQSPIVAPQAPAVPRMGGAAVKEAPPHLWSKDPSDTAHEFLSRVQHGEPPHSVYQSMLSEIEDHRHKGLLSPGEAHEAADQAFGGMMYHSKRKQASRKQAWQGWARPRSAHRKVAGWDWDEHLAGYITTAASDFSCDCGNRFETPTGYRKCACGKTYNSYAIGSGDGREAALDKIICREIPVRPDVIVANKTGKAPVVLNDRWQQNDQGWAHPDGGVIRPSDEKPGAYQLWGPTVTMNGHGGSLAKLKQPHSNPQHLKDWYSWASGEGPKPAGTSFFGSHTAADETLDELSGFRGAGMVPNDPDPEYGHYDDYDPNSMENLPPDDDWPSDHHPDTPKIKSTPKDWHRRDKNQRWTKGSIHDITDVGPLGLGEEDGTPQVKSTPADWHHRDQNQRWTK